MYKLKLNYTKKDTKHTNIIKMLNLQKCYKEPSQFNTHRPSGVRSNERVNEKEASDHRTRVID